MVTTALLASTYFGPVQWYQKLNRYGRCILDRDEHYVKQSYRNRCVIATTQGPLSLTVPVAPACRDAGLPLGHTSMADVAVADHDNWRHLHWNALCSAYGESPFFDFYADDLRPFFEQKWERLFDFNLAITMKMVELLDMDKAYQDGGTIESSQGYLAPDEARKAGWADFREAIRPKHPLPDDGFSPRPYYQVYAQKQGFLPNLSILDLLFNMGPEAVCYL